MQSTSIRQEKVKAQRETATSLPGANVTSVNLATALEIAMNEENDGEPLKTSTNIPRLLPLTLSLSLCVS